MFYRFWVVDAFASAQFEENPAAVVLVHSHVSDRFQQIVAREFNFSETTFLMANGIGSWSLRWFTPVMEVDHCGHATLAAANPLFQMSHEINLLVFTTRSGPLSVSRQADGFAMNLPAIECRKVKVDDRLSHAFDQMPLKHFDSATETVAVFPDPAAVSGLRPDFQKLAEIEFGGT